MNSAIAIWHHSSSLLIRKPFGDVAIATGARLVAIPEQIRCKRGHVGLPLTWRAGVSMLNAANNKDRSRLTLSAEP